MKLLLGGVLLAGIGVGAYALLNRPTSKGQPRPTPTPAFPSPSSPPVADAGDGVYCQQVVTKCADGSYAGSPCECRDRGGVAPRDPNTAIYEPHPLPAPEVIAITNQPTITVSSAIGTVLPTILNPPPATTYSDVYERVWDRD